MKNIFSLKNVKPLFLERMRILLKENKDYENYLEILKIPPLNSIRCNTLKISPENLKDILEKKGWKIKQLWKSNPEVMIIEGKINEIPSEAVKEFHLPKEKEELIIKETLAPLEPGEIGRSLEHLLGYYYVQELASMLPIIALNPNKNELLLDLCAAPGSKTTQTAAKMENTGTIIANEVSLGRLKILSTNTERCGVTNMIITKKEGVAFLKRTDLIFDKILIDAPCSGEGTLRSNSKTALMWNKNTIKTLSKLQKKMVEEAIPRLKEGGELVYSTCTHAPEENEEIVDFVLNNFKNMEIQKINLPIKTREGITQWKEKNYNSKVKFACRVYPQDNNTEGFFISKFKKVKK
jgi:tRNA (cytosine49-C5)-methyltransferase